MDVEFDSVKDQVNRQKHGVSLALGAVILANLIGSEPDLRRDYREARVNAFGIVNDRLYACTYTRRGETYRIISVRKASRQEQRQWLS